MTSAGIMYSTQAISSVLDGNQWAVMHPPPGVRLINENVSTVYVNTRFTLVMLV